MSHLKETNYTYIAHFKKAIGYSSKLFCAAFAVLVHAFVPDVFTKTASGIVRNILDEMQNDISSRILVRFNTKYETDPQRRRWRVLTDGQERLADKVVTHAIWESIEEPVDGIQKYHMMYQGRCKWNGDTATIY